MSALQFLGSLILGALTLGGSVWVALIAARTSRQASAQSNALGWAGQLAERLEAVEARVGALEAELSQAQRVIRAAATFIDRVGLWLAAGMAGARPHPSSLLHEHIDAGLWDVIEDIEHHERGRHAAE